MPKRGRRTLALVALGVVVLCLTNYAVVLGINLSNDAHRGRIVRSVTASLWVGMTADQAERVIASHAIEYSRRPEQILAMVRTPEGSRKLVHTNTQIILSIDPHGVVSSIEVKDVHTGL